MAIGCNRRQWRLAGAHAHNEPQNPTVPVCIVDQTGVQCYRHSFGEWAYRTGKQSMPQRAWFLLLECSHQCWKTSQLTRSGLTREFLLVIIFYSYYITPDEKQVISQGQFFNIPSCFKTSWNSKLSYNILEYSKLSYDILEYSKLS